MYSLAPSRCKMPSFEHELGNFYRSEPAAPQIQSHPLPSRDLWQGWAGLPKVQPQQVASILQVFPTPRHQLVTSDKISHLIEGFQSCQLSHRTLLQKGRSKVNRRQVLTSNHMMEFCQRPSQIWTCDIIGAFFGRLSPRIGETIATQEGAGGRGFHQAAWLLGGACPLSSTQWDALQRVERMQQGEEFNNAAAAQNI